jgi:hypothetical protein
MMLSEEQRESRPSDVWYSSINARSTFHGHARQRGRAFFFGTGPLYDTRLPAAASVSQACV